MISTEKLYELLLITVLFLTVVYFFWLCARWYFIQTILKAIKVTKNKYDKNIVVSTHVSLVLCQIIYKSTLFCTVKDKQDALESIVHVPSDWENCPVSQLHKLTKIDEVKKIIEDFLFKEGNYQKTLFVTVLPYWFGYSCGWLVANLLSFLAFCSCKYRLIFTMERYIEEFKYSPADGNVVPEKLLLLKKIWGFKE